MKANHRVEGENKRATFADAFERARIHTMIDMLLDPKVRPIERIEQYLKTDGAS